MRKQFWMVVALLAGAVCLGGCVRPEVFTERTYSADAGEIQAIEVDVRDRLVYVIEAAGNEVTVECAESPKERYAIEESGGTLRVTLENGTKEWTDYIGTKAPAEERTVQLAVPKGSLDSLSVQTTNGTVNVAQLTVSKSISLCSNGGDVVVRDIGAGKAIRLEAKNGNIEGTLAGEIEDYSMKTSIKKGKSNLPESLGTGPIQLEVVLNNGDVDLEFANAES